MRSVIARPAAVLPVIGLVGLIVLAGPSGPAAADSVATVTTNLGTAQVNCAGGECEYIFANCSVTVTNLTDQDLSLAVSSPVTVLTGSVTWSAPNGDSGTVDGDTGVRWPGAANGYAAIPSGSSITTANCQLSPIFPQEATGADLTQTVQVYPGDYPNLGPVQTVTATTTFLQNGTTVPVGLAVAGPVASAGAGAILLLMHRRRRARTSLPPGGHSNTHSALEAE